MTVRKYSSRAQQTTLSSALTSVATSMVVNGGLASVGRQERQDRLGLGIPLPVVPGLNAI